MQRPRTPRAAAASPRLQTAAAGPVVPMAACGCALPPLNPLFHTLHPQTRRGTTRSGCVWRETTPGELPRGVTLRGRGRVRRSGGRCGSLSRGIAGTKVSSVPCSAVHAKISAHTHRNHALSDAPRSKARFSLKSRRLQGSRLLSHWPTLKCGIVGGAGSPMSFDTAAD